MNKTLLLLPLLLCGCGLLEFAAENQEPIVAVLEATAPLTGGMPVLKWIFLGLFSAGVAKGVYNTIKEKK